MEFYTKRNEKHGIKKQWLKYFTGSWLGGKQVRKFQQTKILELLKTLSEAKDELKNHTSWEVLQSLLADMQNFALQIGQYIEAVAGEGTTAVSLLEEFCNTVYEAYQNQNVLSYRKRFNALIVHMENAVRNELAPDKIEVVFFPYQLSMWDSLESVYLAAEADPNCDVYVVPIPWFDKLPSGEFGTMHYDGGQYPANIPITSWQEYDVKARHPDVIYIHNCYDDGNYVTSVHPDFYSKRLRNCTDLLVYIPYFVTLDDIPEHFCTTPACIYAHKTIVQSEKVCQTYIRAFKKNFGNQFGNPKDKFVALGSPKFDAVMNAKPEDFVLPAEWRNLIYHADGTKKKIVLYNTSVTPMLQWNELYLKKLHSVLNVFQERDDVVLWWRPHPLSEATLQSMRPHLFSEYQKLLTENGTKQGQNPFILDISSDMIRSLVVSDCYFGDGSSLVPLYQVTGKPIMMQNMEMDCYNESERKEFLDSDVVDFGKLVLTIDELQESYPQYYEYWLSTRSNAEGQYVMVYDYHYGVSATVNAFYTMDYDAGTVQAMQRLPDERKIPYLYHPPIHIGGKLIFSPRKSRKWAFYDIANETWTYEDVPEALHPTKQYRGTFGGGFVYQDEIIFLPGESGAFAKYHIHTGKITYYSEWFKNFKSSIKNVDWGWFSSVLYYNDSILLTSMQTNSIIELDSATMRFVQSYTIGKHSCGFSSSIHIPNTDDFYLLPFREPGCNQWQETIMKWNIKSGEYKEIGQLPLQMKEDSTLNACNAFFYWKDSLFITPLQGDSLLRLDTITDEVSQVALHPQLSLFERKADCYTWAKDLALPYVTLDEKRMTFVAQLPYDYSFVDINLETGQVSNRRKLCFEGRNVLNTKEIYESNEIIFENFSFNLYDFIANQGIHTYSKDHIHHPNTVNDGIAGQQIYHYVKNLIFK